MLKRKSLKFDLGSPVRPLAARRSKTIPALIFFALV